MIDDLGCVYIFLYMYIYILSRSSDLGMKMGYTHIYKKTRVKSLMKNKFHPETVGYIFTS